MIFTSSTVVGLSGGEFVGEAAEPDSFSVEDDFGDPSAGAFFEIDADETRRGIRPGLSFIALVL
jgi:hypothetical protein